MTDNKTITSPLAVTLPLKTRPDRRIALNLNVYRNLDHFTNNTVKQLYSEILATQIEGIKLTTLIRLKFTLHRRDRRQGDRANVLCIVEKFFCDALTHYGCLPDDTDEYIESTHYYTGEIDKANPRVDVEIIENYCE